MNLTEKKIIKSIENLLIEFLPINFIDIDTLKIETIDDNLVLNVVTNNELKKFSLSIKEIK